MIRGDCMDSKRNFDTFFFGRMYKSDDPHKKYEQPSNEYVKAVMKGEQQEYRNVIKVGPSRRPPVPVVLNPTPIQVTPIGTIPIYFTKSSKTSHRKDKNQRGKEF